MVQKCRICATVSFARMSQYLLLPLHHLKKYLEDGHCDHLGDLSRWSLVELRQSYPALLSCGCVDDLTMLLLLPHPPFLAPLTAAESSSALRIARKIDTGEAFEALNPTSSMQTKRPRLPSRPDHAGCDQLPSG